jgi:hypothetical protein
MKRLRSLDGGWWVVLLLTVFAVAPLTAPGSFLTAHDATIGAYFLWQFDAGIADGALYPRWAIDWTYGYGHPLFLIIAPLAFYVAEAFHLLGASLIGAIECTYALAFILSGFSMYLLARDLFGRGGGVVAAALYVYAPYHLVDIYVRGDLAEFVSFAFFPVILWTILRLGHAGSRADALRYVALGGLLYGGLILTHITMAMIFTPVALAYAALTCRRQAAAAIALFALGGAISAAYLVPGILEQRYLRALDLVGGFYNYANHFVYPHQLFSPLWDYGYAAIGANDQFSLQLGAVAVVLALAALWALPRHDTPTRRHTAFFLVVAGVVVLAMLPVSQPLWDAFRPVVSFVQFPWRLLSLTALALALAGGSLAAAAADRASPPAAVAPLLLVLVLLGSYTYSTPQHSDGDLSLAKMIQFQLDTGEMLGDTIWVTERPQSSPLVAEYLAGQPPTRAVADDAGVRIDERHRGGASFEAGVTAPQATDVLFRIRYFPGWTVYLDGQRVQPEIRAPQGLMAVAVPAGEHRVLLRFEDTPLRLVTKLASALGIAIALAMLGVAGRGLQTQQASAIGSDAASVL